MRHRIDLRRTPHFLSEVHLLRSANDSGIGDSADSNEGNHGTAQGSSGRLDSPRAQRSGDTRTGSRTPSDWPGKNYGIRAPDQDETPISGAEAPYYHRVY